MNMNWLKTGVFCTAVAFSTGAMAQDDMHNEPDWQAGSPDSAQQNDPHAKADKGTQGVPIDVNGVVAEVDKKTNTLTVVTPLPSASITQIGDAFVVDERTKLVAIRGQWEKSARITRDGKPVKINDLKEGDIVRTSYDSTTDSFGDVSAMSKGELKKEITREIDRAKEENKMMKKDMKE